MAAFRIYKQDQLLQTVTADYFEVQGTAHLFFKLKDIRPVAAAPTSYIIIKDNIAVTDTGDEAGDNKAKEFTLYSA